MTEGGSVVFLVIYSDGAMAKFWTVSIFFALTVLGIQCKKAKSSPPKTPPNTQPPTEEVVDPSSQDNDSRTSPTGEPGPEGTETISDGNCLKGEDNYQQRGPYKFRNGEAVNGHPVWHPSELDSGCPFPVIAFAPGIGAPVFLYHHIFEHFASWGFVVVVDPNNVVNSLGTGLTAGISAVRGSDTYSPYLADKSGVTGHSMGGGAALNISNDKAVSAIASFMAGVSWSSTNKPALYIGGALDPIDPTSRFDTSSGPRFLARLSGVGHNVIGDEMKGAATAWFRWNLAGDSKAEALFRGSQGDNCLLPGGSRWVDCKGLNL